MTNKNRITDLDNEHSTLTFDDKDTQKSIKWYITVPIVLMIIITTVLGVYSYLKYGSSNNKKISSLDFDETTKEKKQIPRKVPQDIDLLKAIQEYKKGSERAAKHIFKNITEIDKPAIVKSYAYTYLGIMADNEGRFNLAANFYKRALKYEPQNFYAHYNLGITYRHKGLFEKAMKEFKKARDLNPNLVDTHIAIGKLQYQQKQFDDARKTLEDASENSKSAILKYNLGMVYKKEGKMAEAKAVFLQAIEMEKSGEIAYKSSEQLGIIYATQGDFENAVYFLKKAIQLSPNSAKYYYNLALVEYKRGKVEQTIINLKKAAQLKNDNPSIYSYIARLYEELGKNYEAEKALVKALDMAPMNTATLLHLSDNYIRQGKFNVAVDTLKKLLRLSTKTLERADAYYNLGRVYTELKDFDLAKKYLKKAIEIDETDEDKLISLGRIYVEEHNPQKTISLYKKALKINPDKISLLKELSQLYLRLGLLTEAETTLKQLTNHPLHKNTDIYFAYLELGKIYQSRKNYNAAVESLKKVLISKNTGFIFEANMNLADVYLEANKPATLAMDFLKNAIALKPNSMEARLMLARALYRDGSIHSQERAIEELTSIVSTTKKPKLLSQAYTLRGIMYYKQSFYLKSVNDFNRAIEINPSNERAFHNKKAALAKLEASN